MNNAISLNPSISIRRHLILGWKINLKLFYILSFSLIIFLSGLCIFQFNQTIKTSYFILNAKNEIAQLSQENKELEINLSKISSLENVEALAKNLNFEKVGKVNYIHIMEERVATK